MQELAGNPITNSYSEEVVRYHNNRSSRDDGDGIASPPYSETSTPPHLRWAESLCFVLEDREGLELFNRYLESECGSKSLTEFWFAMKGLREMQFSAAEGDEEKRKHVAKLIFKNFVRSHGEKSVGLKPKTIKDVARQVNDLHQFGYEVFATAKEEVEQMLETHHAAFVQSQIYLDYISQMQDETAWDSPRNFGVNTDGVNGAGGGGGGGESSSNSSNAGEQVIVVPRPLATVHEDEELHEPTALSDRSDRCGERPSSSSSGAPVGARRQRGDTTLTIANLFSSSQQRRLQSQSNPSYDLNFVSFLLLTK